MSISADEALERLVAGNDRFVRGEVTFAGLHHEALVNLAQGQRPYATILGCSDSRVPPELVFDAGLGELFVVRLAGNVFSPGVAGSLEFAAANLNTPLLVVLGHEGCGAVTAALKNRDEPDGKRSRIHILLDRILPGLPEFDPQLSPAARLAQGVESNVRWTVKQILEVPEDLMRLDEEPMKVIGAIYEIKTGRVRFLS